MAVFFPIFFQEYWSSGVPATVANFRLGSANSLASVIVAGLALFLGGIADQGRSKKAFLLCFALLGSLTTGGLYLVGESDWRAAAALYLLASVGFYAGNIFYDSLLVTVSPPGRIDFVSALGYSLGYLGGGILLAINATMVIWPQSFGLADWQAAV